LTFLSSAKEIEEIYTRCQYIKWGFQWLTIFEYLIIVVAYACIKEMYRKFLSKKHKERDQLTDSESQMAE
jgi:hypothetical protein